MRRPVFLTSGPIVGIGLLLGSWLLIACPSRPPKEEKAQTAQPVSAPAPTPSVRPEEARQRLQAMGFEFTEKAFLDVVQRGKAEAVELFLQAGMSPDVADAQGRTALILAAKGGYLLVVQKLIRAGAHVNARDRDGGTALIWAAWGGHTPVVAELIRAKADVNARDNAGNTALIWAAHNGRTDVVRALLAAGADVNAANAEGKTALQLAIQNGHTPVVQLLTAAGAR
jgi:hypothetical protein